MKTIFRLIVMLFPLFLLAQREDSPLPIFKPSDRNGSRPQSPETTRKKPPSKLPLGLELKGPTVLTLDPACNACNGVPITLQVQNKSSQSVPLDLTTGEITSTQGAKNFNAKIFLVPLEGDDDHESPKRTPVASKKDFNLKATVVGTLDQGSWNVILLNQGKPFGEFKVENLPVAFDVKPDIADAINPEFKFNRGEPAVVTIKNDGSASYSMECAYTIGSVSAPCQLHPATEPKTDAPEKFKVASKGSIDVFVVPSAEWFALRQTGRWDRIGSALHALRGLMSDYTSEGRLMIRMRSTCPSDPAAPVKVFKFKSRLSMYSDEARQISGFVVVFLVLSAGALLSVLANLLLPGAARRLKVKEELAIISRKVADLSMNLDSRLRVPLGVERARLSRSLEELGTVSPDFSTAIAQIDKDVAGLTTRLDILERMELVSRRYWKMRREGRLPMSLTQEIDDLRQQATDVLARSEPKDTDLQNAQLLIQEIEKRIANIDQPNPAFAQQLVSRFQKLQTDLSTVAINNSKILQDLRSDLPDLFTRLTMNLPKAEEIKPADYVDLDTMVFQLAFVNRYNALLRSPLDSKQEQRLKDNRSKLLVLLRQPGWDSLNQARSLIQQLEENVFPEDVLEAVSDNRVEIDADLNQVYQFESVGFRLFFLDKRIASSTAGREFTCKWDFGHDNLSERGGWVSHYFPYPTILTSVMAWKQIIWRLVASSILVFLVLGVPLTWLVGGLKSPIWSLLLADLISLLLTALAIALSPWGRTVRFAIKKKRNPNLASRDADPRYLGPPYLMKASLTTPDGGNTVVVTHSLEVYKTPRTRLPASFWVEVTRITIALLIALAGLVTGAKEQLLKLDVFPALVAIFMIGFGANEVKKLFSQNPQA